MKQVLKHNFRLYFAKFILSNYPFSRGIHFLTRILLFQLSNIPQKASFKFKFGKFVDVSIKKWPWGYWDLFIYGKMENDELYFWTKFLKEGDTVIDVGANFGYWTLVASNLVGSNGKVLSFEPIDNTYKILSRNIEASNVKNVKLYKKGLSDRTCKKSFNICSTDDIGSQSSQGTQLIVNFDRREEVELVSLDSILQEDIIIKLIKIDIEGGELFALKGMENIIRNQRPIITFEWNILTAECLDYHPDEIVSYLESFNYEIKKVSCKKLIDFNKLIYQKNSVLMLWAVPKKM